jgi:hypothetical protein
MTMLPPEAALHAFDVNAFLVCATGTFERPAVESRVTGLDPRKIHSPAAFWARSWPRHSGRLQGACIRQILASRRHGRAGQGWNRAWTEHRQGDSHAAGRDGGIRGRVWWRHRVSRRSGQPLMGELGHSP